MENCLNKKKVFSQKLINNDAGEARDHAETIRTVPGGETKHTRNSFYTIDMVRVMAVLLTTDLLYIIFLYSIYIILKLYFIDFL